MSTTVLEKPDTRMALSCANTIKEMLERELERHSRLRGKCVVRVDSCALDLSQGPSAHNAYAVHVFDVTQQDGYYPAYGGVKGKMLMTAGCFFSYEGEVGNFLLRDHQRYQGKWFKPGMLPEVVKNACEWLREFR
ncbi:MAG: hypothetical protein JWM39_344 [Parcubacteria group bacterium]|nr:hypothetical protein [Parcubacteria group bacterium]